MGESDSYMAPDVEAENCKVGSAPEKYLGGLTSQLEEDLKKKNDTNLKDELKDEKLPESGSGNENDEKKYESVELNYGKLHEYDIENDKVDTEYGGEKKMENDEKKSEFEILNYDQKDGKSEEEHVPENDIMNKDYAVENEMENYEKRDEFKQLNDGNIKEHEQKDGNQEDENVVEENDEFQDKIRRQEESLRKVMRENTTEYEVIDWDEKIRIHRKEIEREESEDEERRERAAKKEKSWELLRL